jgi:hypothetical protein
VLKGPAQHSRRLLAVLSPSLLHDSWTSAALYEALHTLLTIHNKIICVALQVHTLDVTMYFEILDILLLPTYKQKSNFPFHLFIYLLVYIFNYFTL